MSRHENLFNATAEAARDDDLFNLVREAIAHGTESREAALARFLSGSEGFADAARALGGSFAGGASLNGIKRD